MKRDFYVTIRKVEEVVTEMTYHVEAEEVFEARELAETGKGNYLISEEVGTRKLKDSYVVKCQE